MLAGPSLTVTYVPGPKCYLCNRFIPWLALQAVPLTEQSVEARLTDLPRSGAPPRITAEQWCQIMALACSQPEDVDRPLSHWDAREIAALAVEKGIVERISPRHVGRFFKKRRTSSPT